MYKPESVAGQRPANIDAGAVCQKPCLSQVAARYGGSLIATMSSVCGFPDWVDSGNYVNQPRAGNSVVPRMPKIGDF